MSIILETIPLRPIIPRANPRPRRLGRSVRIYPTDKSDSGRERGFDCFSLPVYEVGVQGCVDGGGVLVAGVDVSYGSGVVGVVDYRAEGEGWGATVCEVDARAAAFGMRLDGVCRVGCWRRCGEGDDGGQCDHGRKKMHVGVLPGGVEGILYLRWERWKRW